MRSSAPSGSGAFLQNGIDFYKKTMQPRKALSFSPHPWAAGELP